MDKLEKLRKLNELKAVKIEILTNMSYLQTRLQENDEKINELEV